MSASSGTVIGGSSSPALKAWALSSSHTNNSNEDDISSDASSRTFFRLLTKSQGEVPDPDAVKEYVEIKKNIPERMGQLDPSPFWTEKRKELLCQEMLNNRAKQRSFLSKSSTVARKKELLTKGRESLLFRDLQN